MTYTAAVIGTGPDPDEQDATGYAMAYSHAEGYERADGVELVACADIVPEHAEAFAAEFGLGDEAVFEDYEGMLEAVEPDVVSVTVPPAIHADIVVGCVRSGAVEAVHCEKPMALTFGGARTMAQEADRHDVLLTFNHQRRFGKPFRKAKELLDDGAIGTLQRVEHGGYNLFDYGSHSFDLCNYYNDEVAPEWVLANVDYREESLAFGAHNENHAVVQWKYENGVTGLAATGFGRLSVHNRLVGSRGVLEVGPDDGDAALRVRSDGAWESIDTDGEGLHGTEYIYRAIESVVEAVETGRPSELSARNALNATEIIFGAWESARRRGRVEFPLEVDDNPLEAMVEAGELTPEPASD